MKHLFAVATALGVAGVAQGQAVVTLTNVLDVATPTGGTVYAATYSAGQDVYLASVVGTQVKAFSGTTGAFASDLNMTGTAPAGLGFFGLAAGTDGSIFGFEDTADKLWQWANIGAAPVEAATGVAFTRAGKVVGTGVNTKVALTGDANHGAIHVYTTTDDVTYTNTFDIAVPNAGTATDGAKSTAAVNSTVTEAWGMGDTGAPIKKFVADAASATGWSLDATFAPTSGAGASNIAYDEANDVLFAINGANVFALDADTGAQLGTATVTNAIANATPGYAGAHVTSTPGSGTFWAAGRKATTPSDVYIQKWSYTYAAAASVNDWAIY